MRRNLAGRVSLTCECVGRRSWTEWLAAGHGASSSRKISRVWCVAVRRPLLCGCAAANALERISAGRGGHKGGHRDTHTEKLSKKIKDFQPVRSAPFGPCRWSREEKSKMFWWRRDRCTLSSVSQGALTLTHLVSVSRVCSMMCTSVTHRWPSQLKSG